MLSQSLQLIPYIAIASAALLGATIGVICYNQLYRRSGVDAPRRPILPFVPKLRTLVVEPPHARRLVAIHDRDSSKPQNLDDPFFDAKIRERLGAIIANAALKKVKL